MNLCIPLSVFFLVLLSGDLDPHGAGMSENVNGLSEKLEKVGYLLSHHHNIY